jgi:AraC-like DNA-binding protein
MNGRTVEIEGSAAQGHCDLSPGADLSLQQIAEQVEVSEPSAFHRSFKKWTGLTPGAYRAQEN